MDELVLAFKEELLGGAEGLIDAITKNWSKIKLRHKQFIKFLVRLNLSTDKNDIRISFPRGLQRLTSLKIEKFHEKSFTII